MKSYAPRPTSLRLMVAGVLGRSTPRTRPGRAVPLYLGDARATINPTAAQFSAYGAICKALAVNRSGATRLMWETLQDIAQGSGFPNLAAFNNAEGRTAAEVATMLRTVADSLDPANRAIATVPSRATVPLSALAR